MITLFFPNYLLHFLQIFWSLDWIDSGTICSDGPQTAGLAIQPFQTIASEFRRVYLVSGTKVLCDFPVL